MRRLVDPAKAKVVEDIQEALKVAPPSYKLLSSDIDLKDLLGKTRLILAREIQNLTSESSNGLLCKESSQALVNYTKLLKDLVKDEKDFFDNLSDEELEKLLKDR